MKQTARAPDARRRRYSKWTHLILGAAIGFGLGITPAGAGLPTSATDQTKVPHYFGPFPNWALSPLTLPDATVTIDPPTSGTTATATATVGVGGVVTGIVITNPGSGYTSDPDVTIEGSGADATAEAHYTATGAVTSIAVSGPSSIAGYGSGYTAPTAMITGGGGSGAEATVYGGVHAVAVSTGGAGYTFPVVNFDLPDDAVNGVAAQAYALCDGAINCPVTGTGAITGIVVTQPGSGYSRAPTVVITNGPLYDPINMTNGGPSAEVTATLAVQTVAVTDGGSNYTPTEQNPIVVTIGGGGSGATATASTDYGTISEINVTNPGSDYLTAGGIKKFQDRLPGLCNPAVTGSCNAAKNNLGQYIPLAVPDTTIFTTAHGFTANSDYYAIALVQHRECMSSSLGCANDPTKGTLLRNYVQLASPGVPGTVPLSTDLLDGTSVDLYLPDGSRAYGVTDPHYLGPVIAATKDKAVRITFYNLLPAGAGGNLYIPTDSTLMGAGFGPLNNWPAPNPPVVGAGSVLDGVRNPECTQTGKGTDVNCFRDNRATLHLHGGTSPWISDGTPHQWITPADEGALTNATHTDWPEGESVGNVPDMTGTAIQALGVPDCSKPADGCQTFYYTNQQSTRLMFYHDHASGTTRLNVYLGEAAGYLVSDDTEKALLTPDGSGKTTIPVDQIPLIIQDRTFVPDTTQLSEQDPTWDADRWGGKGNFWYHHVYMPAQNPGDPSGMSAYGRWMYGPWFWPPATPPHGPIPNPYYQMDPKAEPPFSEPLAEDKQCNLNDQTTWQYDTDPFCEPQFIPGTPNISAGMEQFNDTPLVNGTAYPTLTVQPKTYRLRVLNAANDRFWNLSLYEADATGTEVALNASELEAAQTDPTVVPTPDISRSRLGPDWIVIGSEGGFLPAPVVVPPQPTTWITDPTRFDVGNVDKHSLLLAPAERADVIVDFSAYRGKTLIVYNDAPAAFPARVPSYDYYTGAPDMSPNGAAAVLPGYGPNTRTVMQIKVADGNEADAFDLQRLRTAFQHKANGTGVFETSQHPIIVGQAAYNSAYGTNFVGSGDCNNPPSTTPGGSSPRTTCDGFMRINNQGGTWFGFNTLRTGTRSKLQIAVQPKAMHDEMNSAAFDEFGRMTANLGLEASPAGPNGQTITLLPYINPTTEIWDGTKLPSAATKVTPIADAADGSQIWRITHNGVDTHPIHFHLFDVQVLNRVAWDNIILPPHPTELGWKETIRVSPLQDTIVAIRPIIPQVPFEVPNSIRALNPATAFTGVDATMGFNPIAMDPVTGQPVPAVVTNQLVNFGWEYVWHCHILSHEEMDMMRPESLVLPPIAPTWNGLGYSISEARHVVLSFNDNSITETSFLVQGSADGGHTWFALASTTGQPNPVPSPLNLENTHKVRSFTDPSPYDGSATNRYRIVAQNTVGYGGLYPSLTASSVSDPLVVSPTVPTAPSNAAAAQVGVQIQLTFTDNSSNETGFVVQRNVNNSGWVDSYATLAPNATSFTDSNGIVVGSTYQYQVAALSGSQRSGYALSNTVVVVAPPAAPSNASATYPLSPYTGVLTVSFTDNSGTSPGETAFLLQRSTDGTNWTTVDSPACGPFAGTGTRTCTDPAAAVGSDYQYRIAALNGTVPSAAVTTNWVPAAPNAITATKVLTGGGTGSTTTVRWSDLSGKETGFSIQRSTNSGFTSSVTRNAVLSGIASSAFTGSRNQKYYYRVQAVNGAYNSAWVPVPVVCVPATNGNGGPCS
ncbi:multicopper oxidase domain-containing protein [uncultured Thiodictyon sp.]|jgi:FtsP/CotA-like multicopper oxidase with cupredoxin domain|uniref:multicopper oxidase domain-containing protein n=1 Tax=uncultured Thiodictyon sp. TaxID=1846217 RepID=UPI0025E87CB7|nr:multicopper oxidase domain-containing protein [uncultured Thiodictyon sp.]